MVVHTAELVWSLRDQIGTKLKPSGGTPLHWVSIWSQFGPEETIPIRLYEQPCIFYWITVLSMALE